MFLKICITEIGKIFIYEINQKITNLSFDTSDIFKDAIIYDTPLLIEAEKQLQYYFEGRLKKFSLPFEPKGTIFMKSVWNEVINIPYGSTSTYKDIAEKLGNKNASRAVGMANNKNPIPIFIPCHRVIGSNGQLVGYSSGLEIKRKLLCLEKKYK